jgi:hypothetical protein
VRPWALSLQHFIDLKQKKEEEGEEGEGKKGEEKKMKEKDLSYIQRYISDIQDPKAVHGQGMDCSDWGNLRMDCPE